MPLFRAGMQKTVGYQLLYANRDVTGISNVPAVMWSWTNNKTTPATIKLFGTCKTDTNNNQGLLSYGIDGSISDSWTLSSDYAVNNIISDNILVPAGSTLALYANWTGSHSNCEFIIDITVIVNQFEAVPSFWAVWDSIIRRDPSSSQQLVSYLRTMTFTGVPAECTRFCINNYYSNYVVLFLRPTDNLVFDSTTGKVYYPECYRTNAFTPSNNGTQAVSLKSASGSDYLNSPRSSEYGSDWCSVPMNNFDMLYSDNTIAWQQNALLTDLNTTQPT